MKSNGDTHPTWVSWAGPVALLVATGTAAAWLWQTQGLHVPFQPAVSLLALMATLGVVWLFRVRAAHRLFAALDAYAEQELAREAQQPANPANAERRLVRRSA